MLDALRITVAVCLVTLGAGCGGGAQDSSSDDGQSSQSQNDEKDDIVVTSMPVKLAPGEETYLCQYIPPLDVDGWIDRITVTHFEGFHHLFVFRAPDNPKFSRVPAPCEDESSIRDAQLPVVNGGQSRLPEGVAFVFEKTDGLFLQMHLLNTTTTSMEASLTWSAHTVPPNSAQPGGMLRFDNRKILLPPHDETKITKTCPVPIGVQMFEAGGHYHTRTVDFDATIDSTTVVKGIADRHATFDPPIAIREGDPVTWTCDDLNTTESPIVYGGSFAKNEMCNLIIYGFPIADSKTYHCD